MKIPVKKSDALDYYKKCFELVVEEADKRQELCNKTEDQYDKQVYKRLKGSLVTFQRLITRIVSGEDDESK